MNKIISGIFAKPVEVRWVVHVAVRYIVIFYSVSLNLSRDNDAPSVYILMSVINLIIALTLICFQWRPC